MPATLQAQMVYGVAPGTYINTEANLVHSWTDGLGAGTSVDVPVPPAGTNFSLPRTLCLMVMAGGGASTISDRRAYLASACPQGMKYYWNLHPADVYAPPAGVMPMDPANGATPPAAGYDGAWVELTTVPTVWDAAGDGAVDGAKNGLFLVVLVALDATYNGGRGTGVDVPDLILDYNEV